MLFEEVSRFKGLINNVVVDRENIYNIIEALYLDFIIELDGYGEFEFDKNNFTVKLISYIERKLYGCDLSEKEIFNEIYEKVSSMDDLIKIIYA